MKNLTAIFSILFILLFGPGIKAHTPYFEETDYSEKNPFTVRDSIENAKAIYARIEPATDVDAYTFTVTKPVRIKVKAFVPVKNGLERFLPCMAVVGPGIAEVKGKFPFLVPHGYGVVIINNVAPGEQRPIFYEPFSGTKYYDAPAFDQKVSTKGKWYIYYWDPYERGGEYVAILGFKENFF